jgi:hypothetical protein
MSHLTSPEICDVLVPSCRHPWTKRLRVVFKLHDVYIEILFVEHLMAFNAHTTNLKELSYEAIFDRRSKMSGRVGSVFLYAVLRIAEVIDWWFPVKP